FGFLISWPQKGTKVTKNPWLKAPIHRQSPFVSSFFVSFVPLCGQPTKVFPAAKRRKKPKKKTLPDAGIPKRDRCSFFASFVPLCGYNPPTIALCSFFFCVFCAFLRPTPFRCPMPNDLSSFRDRLLRGPDPTLTTDIEKAVLARRSERSGHTDWGLLCEDAGL